MLSDRWILDLLLSLCLAGNLVALVVLTERIIDPAPSPPPVARLFTPAALLFARAAERERARLMVRAP
jgi:hypothetical protein